LGRAGDARFIATLDHPPVVNPSAAVVSAHGAPTHVQGTLIPESAGAGTRFVSSTGAVQIGYGRDQADQRLVSAPVNAGAAPSAENAHASHAIPRHQGGPGHMYNLDPLPGHTNTQTIGNFEDAALAVSQAAHAGVTAGSTVAAVAHPPPLMDVTTRHDPAAASAALLSPEGRARLSGLAAGGGSQSAAAATALSYVDTQAAMHPVEQDRSVFTGAAGTTPSLHVGAAQAFTPRYGDAAHPRYAPSRLLQRRTQNAITAAGAANQRKRFEPSSGTGDALRRNALALVDFRRTHMRATATAAPPPSPATPAPAAASPELPPFPTPAAAGEEFAWNAADDVAASHPQPRPVINAGRSSELDAERTEAYATRIAGGTLRSGLRSGRTRGTTSSAGGGAAAAAASASTATARDDDDDDGDEDAKPDS
jgi:hypothetical protein